MSLRCSEKEKFFKFFSSDVQIRITIENEIYWYVNGFLKQNISKKTSYIVRNKFFSKICILSKELSLFENFLSTQLSTIDFYILTKSITSYTKKSLHKLLYFPKKKLSSLTRNCNLPIFTANETITNLMHYEFSQEESDLLKVGLYFSIQ